VAKKKAPAATAPPPPPAPRVYEASPGAAGAVRKGREITQAEAEALRRAGQDVVVCGPDLNGNRALAQTIERNANGSYKRCPPHKNAGPRALPHFQPDPRPPEGHTFYETDRRKAQ
jgi:hypothetical protein